MNFISMESMQQTSLNVSSPEADDFWFFEVVYSRYPYGSHEQLIYSETEMRSVNQTLAASRWRQHYTIAWRLLGMQQRPRSRTMEKSEITESVQTQKYGTKPPPEPFKFKRPKRQEA